MAKYKMEIFEAREGQIEPVLRERHDIYAASDEAAIDQAKRRYKELLDMGVTLANFCLYGGTRLIYELPRRMRSTLSDRTS